VKIFISALSFLVLSKVSFASDVVEPSGVAKRVLAVCADWETRGKFSGTLLVKSHGIVDVHKAFGDANSELAIPNTTETVYRIGAITRSFTSVAVLKLASENRVALDDTLEKHLPEFASSRFRKVSIHQLLSHSSGIPDYLPTWKTAWQMRGSSYNPPEGGAKAVVAQLAELEPRFEPGFKAEASSSNAMLLGRIVEKVAARPFAEVMQRLFEGMSLRQTGFYMSQDVPLSSRAVGYTAFHVLDPRGWFSTLQKLPQDLRHPEWDLAASAAYSTTSDLERWLDALQNTSFLASPWREKIFTKHISKNSTQAFGYGFEILHGKGVEVAVQFGAHPGFQSVLMFIPKSNTSIVILQNFGDSSSSRNRFFREVVQAALQEN
jgi:CubicO group peptidase (beta-lactamase class C family)